MRAAVCRSYGPPEVVQVDELPTPALADGQARVRVAAAAVNFPDVLLVADKYQMSVDLPFVPGSEFAGAVKLDPKSKEPMIATQNPAESIFVIPQANGAPPVKITGFSTFITTKAAAYCFLPSITALKFISNLG